MTGRFASPARLVAATAFAALATAARAAHPVEILFVGDSYTFGRVDPVMRFNASNVHDLTAAFAANDPTGTNAYEPHRWGGVPGLFKALTDEAGLAYDVSISARNATSLRGHLLDTAGDAWPLRDNVALRKWDVVVLQDLSDIALPAGRGKNANDARFTAYATRFEQFIHAGAAQRYTEAELYGGLAACEANGSSPGACATTRVIPANPHASADTRVYLTETWARPDMVFPHRVVVPDRTSPAGEPVVATGRKAGPAPLYYARLADMSADLHADVRAAAASDGRFAGVIPVGDAFQLAVDLGVAQANTFYDASGVFVPRRPDAQMDLWWDDRLHASKYGSYLDALVQFGEITGRDPASLGPDEAAARALGITPTQSARLEEIAAAQLHLRPACASWPIEGDASPKRPCGADIPR